MSKIPKVTLLTSSDTPLSSDEKSMLIFAVFGSDPSAPPRIRIDELSLSSL